MHHPVVVIGVHDNGAGVGVFGRNVQPTIY